jgi:hypothetical protein
MDPFEIDEHPSGRLVTSDLPKQARFDLRIAQRRGLRPRHPGRVRASQVIAHRGRAHGARDRDLAQGAAAVVTQPKNLSHFSHRQSLRHHAGVARFRARSKRDQATTARRFAPPGCACRRMIGCSGIMIGCSGTTIGSSGTAFGCRPILAFTMNRSARSRSSETRKPSHISATHVRESMDAPNARSSWTATRFLVHHPVEQAPAKGLMRIRPSWVPDGLSLGSCHPDLVEDLGLELLQRHVPGPEATRSTT